MYHKCMYSLDWAFKVLNMALLFKSGRAGDEPLHGWGYSQWVGNICCIFEWQDKVSECPAYLLSSTLYGQADIVLQKLPKLARWLGLNRDLTDLDTRKWSEHKVLYCYCSDLGIFTAFLRHILFSFKIPFWKSVTGPLVNCWTAWTCHCCLQLYLTVGF